MEADQQLAPADSGQVERVGRTGAVTVVVLSSAAVLMLEVLSIRLVAPYAGLTLDTYTAAIGVTLAAIAFGAALGGQVADSWRPAALVGPLLVAGGVLLLFARPVVLLVGPGLRGYGPVAAVALVGLGIAAPVAVLSAVPPIVVKSQLKRLDQTGTVVGAFSATGTVGALAGTFLTGYVLVATLPVSRVLLVTGGLLVSAGLAYTVRHRGGRARTAQLLAVTVLAGGVLVLAPAPCDYETAYYCARVAADPQRPGGRVLYLDDIQHAYVDLDDPTYLEFSYTRQIADAVDALAPPGRPLRALHVGGGGFTVPRWLAATHPGSASTVLELDPVVLRLAREKLGLRTGPALRVRVGDARLGIADEPSGRYDVVVGDAFGSLSVPWHLATREFVAEVRRVLRPGGLYVQNVIDHPPLRFLAAEMATLRAVFPAVTVTAAPAGLDGESGGNFVLVAGTRLPERLTGARSRDWSTATTAQLTRLTGHARVLTDDWAPVDQLLTPYQYSKDAL